MKLIITSKLNIEKLKNDVKLLIEQLFKFT